MNFKSAFLFFIHYKLKYIVFAGGCCLYRQKTLSLRQISSFEGVVGFAAQGRGLFFERTFAVGGVNPLT